MKLTMLAIFLLLGIAMAAEKNYTGDVLKLKDFIQTPLHKHSAWNRLAQITDTFGTRLWGSQTLELVILQMKRQAEEEGFENITLEGVTNFTAWQRNEEQLYLQSPRVQKLDVIGLGGSVSSNGPIHAQVIVVRNYQQLNARMNDVKGKIVCYNNEWKDYYSSVSYRVEGPSKAAAYGAVATLVRSIASQSIYSVHTGYMQYDPNVPNKIPCGAITVQDAQMFQRMQDRGQTITVNLTLNSKFKPNSNSYNLIFQIPGYQFPEQIILAGGHIDSWDTGSQTGANDDGGGFISVFEAFRLLKKNGFKARRTLRFIAWSGQESGSPVDGAAQYLQAHKDEIDNHIAGLESDLGSTQLLGFGHFGPGKQIVNMILQQYMSILNVTQYDDTEVFAVDLEEMNSKYGVPIFSPIVKDSPEHNFYFRYHHSAGDSMSMMNPDQMDSNVVGIATFLYILADLETTVRSVPTLNLRSN